MNGRCHRAADGMTVEYSQEAAEDVEESLKDFVKEGRLLNKICQADDEAVRYIVPVNEVIEANNTAYFVMQYLEGGSLRRMVLAGQGGLSEDNALALIKLIARAVDFIHRHKVLHMDIKPENIVMHRDLLTGQEEPVLIDFGVSLHFNKKGGLTSKHNVIYIKPFAALAGSQATISVKMKNTAEIRSFQFDLQLPDGVTVVKSAKGKIQGSLSAGRLPEEDEHTLSFSEHEGNVIRFLCGSLSDETFTGNDGEIATLQVDVAANVEAEDHTVYLRNMKLSESDISKFYQTEELGTTLAVAPEGSARGDANGDKSVSVTDIAVVVNEILQITNTGGFMMYGADANGDGDITVTDIGVIVDKILGTKTSASSRKMEQEVEPQ